MVVYLVEHSTWEEHHVDSVWSSKEKAEAEISRMRKMRISGRLSYPKERYSLYVVEYDVDPTTEL